MSNPVGRPSKNRASNRPTRSPMKQKGKLHADAKPGFARRWVNDVDGRVQDFMDRDYSPVIDPSKAAMATEASQLGSAVRKPVGGGVEAVLMEIPQAYFDEDQEAKELAIKEKERSLLSEAGEGFYGKGITINRDPAPKVTIDE